jgi:phage replication-related protein YjqB (UPF0714/DUF867 family)
MTALLKAESPDSYTFEIREPASDVAIIAPHGGKIEWGTNQIASAIQPMSIGSFVSMATALAATTAGYTLRPPTMTSRDVGS